LGEGGRWDDGIRFTGEIQLGVIHIAVKMYIIFTENIAMAKEVKN